MKGLSFITILFIGIFYTFLCKNLNEYLLSEEKEKEIVTIRSDDEQALRKVLFICGKKEDIYILIHQ